MPKKKKVKEREGSPSFITSRVLSRPTKNTVIRSRVLSGEAAPAPTATARKPARGARRTTTGKKKSVATATTTTE